MNVSVTDRDLELLAEKVAGYMGERRYQHTIGVAKMAEKLAAVYLPDEKNALVAAALLHDVAKELPIDMQAGMVKDSGVTLDPSDLLCPPIFHSFAGKVLILRDFPEYAHEPILSAVASHTVGRDGMSLFEEIVYLSDFIEEGRPYPSSIALRKRFFSELSAATTDSQKLNALHRAAISAADATLDNLAKTGKPVGKTLISTKKYLKRLILPD